MNIDQYQLKSGLELLSYEFISEGSKGLITKCIQFTLVNRQGVYNLAFGDKDFATGGIDDKVVSNNGDSEKVLATVVGAVFAFLDQHPGAWIFAAGSTFSRTRLYQMGIAKYYNEISHELEIYGQIKDTWHPFEKHKEYQAFVARLKTS
ncbi:DUF6934 family protein [Foetidibacter luteolus]|uniref:DUF6934 family protein n=1 Tax=Foetidibacter luteolus TaxID=2608880 RepID=UPI001A986100|nr:hypothetical protein [Foetidibacter luteolus]